GTLPCDQHEAAVARGELHHDIARLPEQDPAVRKSVGHRVPQRTSGKAICSADQRAGLEGKLRQCCDRFLGERVSRGRFNSRFAARGGEQQARQHQCLAHVVHPSHVLNLKSITSPSWTTYSLPSARDSPCSRAAFHPFTRTKSSYATVSARMKPRSKSEWMTPAASGALAPRRTVHARTSFSPAVK